MSPLCHRVIQSMPEYMQPLHLTTKVERRLPPDAVAEVERIEREWPHKEQCEKNPFVSGQTCIQLMLELRTVLDKCTTWPPSLHVPCVMHGCPGGCEIRALALERQQLEERIQSGLNHVGSFSSSSKTDTGGSSTVPRAKVSNRIIVASTASFLRSSRNLSRWRFLFTNSISSPRAFPMMAF